MAAFAQVHIVCTLHILQPKLDSVARPVGTVCSPACGHRSKRVSSNSMVLDCVLRCQPNHGWWCHGIASSDGRISHLVNQKHLVFRENRRSLLGSGRLHSFHRVQALMMPMSRRAHKRYFHHLLLQRSRTASGRGGRLPPSTCCNSQHRLGHAAGRPGGCDGFVARSPRQHQLSTRCTHLAWRATSSA